MREGLLREMQTDTFTSKTALQRVYLKNSNSVTLKKGFGMKRICENIFFEPGNAES